VRLKAGSAYQDRNLVFATRVGTPINPSNLRNRSFVPLLKKAGLPHITFPDLRHTTASLLFSKNVHPKFVQELLGHASVAFTLDIYSHCCPAWAARPPTQWAKPSGNSQWCQKGPNESPALSDIKIFSCKAALFQSG
jgi:integrase